MPVGYPPAVHDARDDATAWDRATVSGVSFRWRVGCRGHPEPPAGWALLAGTAAELDGETLDASQCLGVPARAVAAGRVRVLESSALALEALAADLEEEAVGGAHPRAAAGLPWDAPAGAFDAVLLAPPAERGSARVHAETAAAARALRPGGRAWLLLEKDRGAKRYERDALRWFETGTVVARRKGFRLSRLEGPRADAAPDPWTRFDGPFGEAWALAGCWAAGKTDPGTRLLLRELEAAAALPEGGSVLDLGCGWGPLAWAADRRGAQVTACDDDLAAVRSCERNVPGARVLHADLDGGLPSGARFARVLVNPPFHVGAGVRLALGRAFLAAARRRVTPDGEIWLVANRDLPYETAFAADDEVVEAAREGAFKVLRVRPRSGR